MQGSEAEKRKQKNAKAELITRKSGEVVYLIPPTQRRDRENYPWEETTKDINAKSPRREDTKEK